MVSLTAGQSIAIFGWARPRRILLWRDVVKRQLKLDGLLELGLSPNQLLILQPDPAQWVAHAGAELRHARLMLPWGANPFVVFGADLADILSMRLNVVELMRMGITHAHLKAQGMNDEIERMFKFSDEEWALLGRTSIKAPA